jgi:hypothetical protein
MGETGVDSGAVEFPTPSALLFYAGAVDSYLFSMSSPRSPPDKNSFFSGAEGEGETEHTLPGAGGA